MITRYVNTASTTGGDGTTNETTGASRAYHTLEYAAGAIAGTLGPYVTSDVEILCCGLAADTTPVTGTLATIVQANYTLYVKSNRNHVNGFHGGKWNDSTYRIVTLGNTPVNVYSVTSGPIVFDGIQFYSEYSVGRAMNVGMNTTCTIDKCILKTGGTPGPYHIITSTPYSGGYTVIKNSVLNAVTPVAYFGIDHWGAGTTKVYNSLIRGATNYTGVFKNASTGPLIVKNCAVFDNADDFNAGITIYNCASDDGDGNNPVSVSGGWSNQFVSGSYVADSDFRLKGTSTLLKSGIGPASDSDVPVENMRSSSRHGSYCDVGPFEYSNFKQRFSFAGPSTQSGL